MLSKFFYKTLMVFAFAFVAQVGYSQYVSTEVAIDRLEQAIDNSQPGSNTSVGSMSAEPNANAFDVKVMTKIQSILEEGDTNVAKTLTLAESKAAEPGSANQAKLVAAIEKVKTLLLN